MRKLALKVDVDTLRGILEGVPPLVFVLQKHDAQAALLFSLWPDNTDRVLGCLLLPGFLKKALRMENNAVLVDMLASGALPASFEVQATVLELAGVASSG